MSRKHIAIADLAIPQTEKKEPVTRTPEDIWRGRHSGELVDIIDLMVGQEEDTDVHIAFSPPWANPDHGVHGAFTLDDGYGYVVVDKGHSFAKAGSCDAIPNLGVELTFYKELPKRSW